MMRSAGGIDKVTVSSIANIMSARDGLHVRFMKGHRAEGSHDVLKSGERLILLNPEKTEGKYWRRDILFHELWHDLSRDGGTKVLTEEIYRRSLPAFQHMVVDRYTKYYNGVSMSQFLDGKKWTEENVKAYFDTYTKISYDEVMEEVAAGTAGRVMGSKNFIKNFRDVSLLRRIFYGISDFCRAMVNKTYMTNGEETAGFMLSFKEALTFRRLYELAYTKERFHLDEGVLRAMEEIFMERDEGDSERAKTKKSLSLYESYTEKYEKLDLNQDISTLDGVPAIRLMDGSILPFTEPHVTFIQNNGIDVEDIESGGWISGGIYEASERSDTMRYKERMLAKKRMDEKRAAKSTKMSLSLDGEYNPEIANIKDQLRNSQNQLNQMEVVFSATVPKSFENRLQSKKWAEQELKKYGFKADRQGFGIIEFSKDEIYRAIEHLNNDEERAATVAIYYVIKRGIQIGEHGDHKLRKKHTVTFAAPVEINGIRGNMAVVINMRNKKYYIHRLIQPDGSPFRFEENKNAVQRAQRGVPKRSLANAKWTASDNSISQPTPKVNSKKSLSLDADIPSLSAAEVEGDANRVSWGFSWTDEKLLSNIRKVQKYFRERYPDHMVEFELDNKKKRVVVVAVQPWRFREDFSGGFTVPLAENDAYHEELTALFRSIGISDDRISEHISVFETEEEKNETIERAKKKNEGRRLKVYHKQEVAKSIEGVLSNVLSPIVGPSKLMGKKKRALITRLWQELNRAKASEREKLAERFAEELIVSTVYDDYEVNAEYEQMLVDGTVESYETVEGYRGKLSAEDVSGDLVSRYGEKRAKAIMRRWLSKEGGVAVGTALAEMQNEGILTEVTAKNDADLLIALNEEYERLKERTSMRRELLPLAAMSEERLSSIKNELKTSLLTFFSEGGKDTKYGKLARRYQEQGKYYIETLSSYLAWTKAKLTPFSSRAIHENTFFRKSLQRYPLTSAFCESLQRCSSFFVELIKFF